MHGGFPNPMKKLLRALEWKIVCIGLAVTAAVAGPVGAEQPILSFNGSSYITQGGDVELARPPKPARSSIHTIYAFGPASPEANYYGPAFSLGYEVRASAPINLTVLPEKCVVQDDFANGADRFQDTITLTAQGNWPETETFSVAAVVVFPTPKFKLGGLSFSALNFTGNKAYNERLRHRWVVRVGEKYYVSTAFLGRPGRGRSEEAVGTVESKRFSGRPPLHTLEWVEFDPSVSIFANFERPGKMLEAALDEVTAVGFYMDALDFPGNGPGRQWELRLISFAATGEPVK